MASAFGHIALGLSLAYSTSRKPMGMRFWVLMAISSVLPDIDVIGFKMGIHYGDCWGHRGATHSAVLALGWALLSCFVFLGSLKRGSMRWFNALFGVYLATLSHSFLDALTNGGLGVAILWPWSCERYFFGWRPIEVSPISITAFMSGRAFEILQSEFYWIAIPCSIWIFLVFIKRRIKG